MAFASRSDLLARSNARRLAQLAVPADVDMVPDEALRLAIAGGDLSAFTDADQAALVLALEAIDDALNDANALILTYGIPDTVQTTLLARLTSTIALYNLQGAERMTEEVRRAYEGAVAILNKHQRGELNLVPAQPTDPVPSGDLVILESRPGRYGRQAWPDEVGL